MDTVKTAKKDLVPPPARSIRPYDSTLRRERAAATRERIIDAGSEILHRSSVRDWKKLTFRAVAERSGVHPRTVYRYFGSERELRDAVMHRHEQEAGINLAGMQLEDIATVTAHKFEHVSHYPRDPHPPLDPTLADAQLRLKDALLGSVANRAEQWSSDDRMAVAAVFDVLWSVACYERLVDDWQLSHESAIKGISWVIGLCAEAVQNGRGPTEGRA
jgi:AcrR family transcriptional regulator